MILFYILLYILSALSSVAAPRPLCASVTHLPHSLPTSCICDSVPGADTQVKEEPGADHSKESSKKEERVSLIDPVTMVTPGLTLTRM